MEKTRRLSLIAQAAKYLVGGNVYFWIGYLLFALGYSGFGLPWLAAKIIGDVTGRTCEYMIQRFWTFRTESASGFRPVRRYGGLVLLNTLIDYSIVGGLQALGISPYLGLFVSAGFFTVWNYVWYKIWVFKR